MVPAPEPMLIVLQPTLLPAMYAASNADWVPNFASVFTKMVQHGDSSTTLQDIGQGHGHGHGNVHGIGNEKKMDMEIKMDMDIGKNMDMDSLNMEFCNFIIQIILTF